jgi:hypothetical protein
MQAILGVLFHSLGGIAAGSFYMPYNKVKGWAMAPVLGFCTCPRLF